MNQKPSLKLIRKTALASAFILLAFNANAHKGQKHPQPDQPNESPQREKERLDKINELYQKDVKSIFQKSCFDCHSQTPRLPWYHVVPLIRGLIDSDIKEAREHLDFTEGFPFQGHGSPREDLEEIDRTIQDGTMPPFRYRIMHPSAALSKSDRETIKKWISESQILLDEPRTPDEIQD